MTPWPYEDTMHPQGTLGEWELDAACWRKRQIKLTTEQCRAVDDTAGLCGTCGGECPTPQACEQADVAAHHARKRWLIVTLAVLLGAVIAAACIAGYLRVLRWQLACLRDEQRLYVDTGRAGPIFERKTRQQQLEVMARIREITKEDIHV